MFFNNAGYKVGEGTKGYGNQKIAQNQVNIAVDLDSGLLNKLQQGQEHAMFPRLVGSGEQIGVKPGDWLVTYSKTKVNFTRPLVHSVFNGDGVREIQAYQHDSDAQTMSLLSKYRPIGTAFFGAEPWNLSDVGKQNTFSSTILGTGSDIAVEDIHQGAILQLVLPKSNEPYPRRMVDPQNSIKLILKKRTPQTIWQVVNGEIQKHVYSKKNNLDLFRDNNYRKIDAGYNAYEAFSNAAIIFGLEFLQLLVQNKVINITQNDIGAGEGVSDDFDLKEAGVDLNNFELILGLAQAFGIIDKSKKINDVAVPLDNKLKAFFNLRKALTGMVFYDGETINAAFHHNFPDRLKNIAKQVTSHQHDTIRTFISATDDLISESNKWSVATCIESAKQSHPVRFVHRIK